MIGERIMSIWLSILEIWVSKVGSFLSIILHVFYNEVCDIDGTRLFAFSYVFWWAEFNGEIILSLGLSLLEISDINCNYPDLTSSTDKKVLFKLSTNKN